LGVEARLQRWAVYLSGYHYNIEFKPTGDHANADSLSRLPLESQHTEMGEVNEISIFNIAQISALPVTAAEVQSATRTDPDLSKVLQYTLSGWPQDVPESLKPFYYKHTELTTEAGCVLWGIRMIVPKKLRTRVLQELHRDHPG